MARIEKQNHNRSLQQLPPLDVADAWVADAFHPEGKLVDFAGTPPMYDCTYASSMVLLAQLTSMAHRLDELCVLSSILD